MSGAGQRGDPAGAPPRPSFTWPPRYPVRTTDEVLAGLRTDAYFLEHLRYLRAETGEPHPPVIDPRAGVPVRVVGIHKPYTVDVWLVPIRERAGDVVSIVDVRIDDDGLGSALTARGWSGPFPRVAEADARTLASAPDDPAVDATLGWAEEYIASPGGATAPVWLITRRGGAQLMVTEERGVVPVTR
jgi:hypothetical protein